MKAARARGSLAEFIRQGWFVLEPATPLEWNWHIDAVAVHLQAMFEDWLAVQQWRQRQQIALAHEALFYEESPRQRIQNIVINIPPGTGKSRIFSVFFCCWVWLHAPTFKSIYLSANQRVAERDSDYARLLLQSEWFSETFAPEWTLDPNNCGKRKFGNTLGGLRQALPYFTRMTGDRADGIFVDDPHDAAEVHSPVKRGAVLRKWDDSLGNRVNDLRTSIRGLIMQRLHEEDLAGHNLRRGGWEHLMLPMEYAPAPPCACPSCKRGETAIGWRDPRTKTGEILHSARFTPEVLAAERVRLGSAGYAGQMQQWPVPAGGKLFKDAWFANTYKAKPTFKSVFTLWDTAMKDEEENDETACLTIGEGDDGFLYLLRVVHWRAETPDVARFLIEQALWLKKLYGETYKGDFVEDKSSGTTLMQYIRRDERGKTLALVAVRTGRESKQERAHGVTPLVEAQRVRLPDIETFPDAAQWVEAFLAQVISFPFGLHDDIVDVFVYALKRYLGTLKTGKGKSRRGRGVPLT